MKTIAFQTQSKHFFQKQPQNLLQTPDIQVKKTFNQVEDFLRPSNLQSTYSINVNNQKNIEQTIKYPISFKSPQKISQRSLFPSPKPMKKTQKLDFRVLLPKLQRHKKSLTEMDLQTKPQEMLKIPDHIREEKIQPDDTQTSITLEPEDVSQKKKGPYDLVTFTDYVKEYFGENWFEEEKKEKSFRISKKTIHQFGRV